MNFIKNIAATAVSAAAVGALTLSMGAAPAHASDDDRVIKRGACSEGANWKLKVKTDDGGLEIEGEVDSNIVGQSWKWTFRQNGDLVARGTSTTLAPSGSFDVERHVTNNAGTDRIVFRATNDGQVCRGSIAYTA
jgi:hypothetical protein